MENNTEPTKRKSLDKPPVDESVVDKEIEEIFGKAPMAEEPLSQTLDKFIVATSKSKVAVIVPMFGYWNDVKDCYLDADIISATLNRVSSHAHSLYAIVVAEPERIPQDVAQEITKKNIGGNVKGVRMPVGSTYGEYVCKGMEVAMEETDAAYFIVLNPWVIIQQNGIDTLVDRVNLDNYAPVVCGYDLRGELTPDQFVSYSANTPREKLMLNFNFIGLQRFVAEMAVLDHNFKTRVFLERDFFQTINSKGYHAISSERVPIFSFDVPWDEYVPREWYEEDKAYFEKKWGFAPANIKYE